MKRWVSVLLQIVGGLGQIANVFVPILSERQKIYVAGSIGVGQLIVNAIAHGSNPDGTPAEVAWQPDVPNPQEPPWDSER